MDVTTLSIAEVQARLRAREISPAEVLAALMFMAIVIPVALHRIVRRLHIHHTLEVVVGVGLTMLVGVGLPIVSVSRPIMLWK